MCIFDEKIRLPAAFVTANSLAHLTSFRDEKYFQPPPSFRVVAILSGYNEADVLASAVSNLIRDGIDVHSIDNWSTDSSLEVIADAQRRLGNASVTWERWPSDKPATYNWVDILQHKAELTLSIQANWFLHQDCDEIRDSPWGPLVSLRQAIYAADALGYNLVSFGRMFIFHPIRGAPVFAGEVIYDLLSHISHEDQIKGWKQMDPHRITITLSGGGHIAKFTDSRIFPRVFPYEFVVRHYPIRSQQHGMQKVFQDRKPRWNPDERRPGRQWHAQYDHLREDHDFLRSASDPNLLLAPAGTLPPEMYARWLMPTHACETSDILCSALF